MKTTRWIDRQVLVSRQGHRLFVPLALLATLVGCGDVTSSPTGNSGGTASPSTGGGSASERSSGGLPGKSGAAGSSAGFGGTGSLGTGGSGGIGGQKGATTPSGGGSGPKGGTGAGGSAIGGSAGRGAGGSASPSGGTGSRTPATEAFVQSYVAPYCARVATCCEAQKLPTSGLAACAEYELQFYRKTLDDGTAVASATGIQAFLDAIQTSCDQPSYGLRSMVSDGTRKVGEPCTGVEQCAGDNRLCLVPSQTKPGICVAATRAKEGEPCQVTCDNTSTCRWSVIGASSTTVSGVCWDEDGLHCDSERQICVALKGIGKACESFPDCGVHADCNSGVCQAKGKVGDDCRNGRGCESTLICDSTTYKCVKMSLAWSGSCTPGQ